jgi:hypothetical protein
MTGNSVTIILLKKDKDAHKPKMVAKRTVVTELEPLTPTHVTHTLQNIHTVKNIAGQQNHQLCMCVCVCGENGRVITHKWRRKRLAKLPLESSVDKTLIPPEPPMQTTNHLLIHTHNLSETFLCCNTDHAHVLNTVVALQTIDCLTAVVAPITTTVSCGRHTMQCKIWAPKCFTGSGRLYPMCKN